MSNSWKTYKLGEIADVQNGYAFKASELVDKGIPVIKIKNIISPNVSIEDVSYFKEASTDFLKKYFAKKGDFLISMTGSTVNVMSSAVGKMGRYRLENKSLINQRVGKIYVTKPEIVSFEYLCQFLNRYEIHYNLALNATGSANQANISPAQIKDINVLLPSLEEQKSIAQILSTIDDKIENNLAINKTLEEMAMALYKHWFVDFGPYQDGEFVDSELGKIPEGWMIGKLEDLLEIKYGKDHKKLEEGNIPVYGSGGIMRYVNESLYDKESILIPRKGTLSNLFYVSQPFWSVDTMFYSKIKDICFGKYIFYFLKSADLASMDVGSAVPSLTTELLKRIQIIIPPKSIVNEFNEIMNSKFNIIESNIKENQTLTQLRDSLLPKLISGEVRLKEFRESITN